MNILVMWSGGIDSTYILAKLLEESSDAIFAHHIHLVNKEKRHISEHKSILSLVPKLREIRDFHYSESVVQHLYPTGLPYDMAVVCFEAGVIMKSIRMGERYIIDQWMIGTHESEGHWQERFDILLGGTKAAHWDKDPKFYEPPPFKLHDLVSKKEEIQYLKDLDIYDHCWFCRTPVNGMSCGSCNTCVEVKSALTQ